MFSRKCRACIFISKTAIYGEGSQKKLHGAKNMNTATLSKSAARNRCRRRIARTKRPNQAHPGHDPTLPDSKTEMPVHTKKEYRIYKLTKKRNKHINPQDTEEREITERQKGWSPKHPLKAARQAFKDKIPDNAKIKPHDTPRSVPQPSVRAPKILTPTKRAGLH